VPYARRAAELLAAHGHADHLVKVYPGTGHLLEPPLAPLNRLSPRAADPSISIAYATGGSPRPSSRIIA
ncbi:MAG: acyl-CoA thioester hydrolase/BAAT C-terminal domain-containing protein, partial [Candidatus Puniceispirillaceae bacterium]